MQVALPSTSSGFLAKSIARRNVRRLDLGDAALVLALNYQNEIVGEQYPPPVAASIGDRSGYD